MLPSEEMTAGNNVNPSSAFLNKLWKIVNDPQTDNLIKWSENGKSFIITNQIKFTQQLIPKYFKHNNMASFVRQLNMYGFHKVSSVEAGGLVPDKGDIEFSHPRFLKGQHSLIDQIKRKSQGPRAVMNQETAHSLPLVLSEVEKMRKNQESIETKLLGVKKENELLWREYANVRQKFSKQQQIIEKLVQFLVAMVKSPGQPLSQKRKFNHLALEGAEGGGMSTSSDKETSSLEFEPTSRLRISGPVIHDVTTLTGQSEPLVLEKVFDSCSEDQTLNNSVTSIPTPSSGATRRVGESSGKRVGARPNKTRTFVKKEQPEQVLTYVDNLSNEFLTQAGDVDESIFAQNGILQIPTAEESQNASFSPVAIQLDAANNTNIIENISPVDNHFMMVTSPDGTVLETVNTSIDSEYDPEVMRSVDPALVSPNIVVAVPNKINELQSTSLPPGQAQQYSINPLTVSRQNSNSGKIRGMQLPNSAAQKMVNEGKLRQGKLTPYKGKNVGYKGKNIGKNTPSYRTGKALESSSPLNNSVYTTSSDLAVPEKLPFESNDELANHVDEMQLSLESIQDILNSSNFNVDTSTILSLFGNDETFGHNNDIPVTSQDQADNQLSVYNPSLIDFLDEEVTSLRESEQGPRSTSKLPRLNVKKEIPTNSRDYDDTLNTPHPNLDDPSPFYS